MKSMKPVKALLILSTLLVAGCASNVDIRPDTDSPVDMDGHEAQAAKGDQCEVMAYSVKNKYKDLLVEVRVKNKGKGFMELLPSHFALSGPAMKGETLKAVEPDVYFTKMLAEADNLEKRTKMKTYEGVDVLTQSMPGAEKDEDLQKARRDFEGNEAQKKKDLQTASDLRDKEHELRPVLMRKTAIPSYAEAQGKILFPGPFPREGKITLMLVNPKCEANLPFVLSM